MFSLDYWQVQEEIHKIAYITRLIYAKASRYPHNVWQVAARAVLPPLSNPEFLVAHWYRHHICA